MGHCTSLWTGALSHLSQRAVQRKENFTHLGHGDPATVAPWSYLIFLTLRTSFSYSPNLNNGAQPSMLKCSEYRIRKRSRSCQTRQAGKQFCVHRLWSWQNCTKCGHRGDWGYSWRKESLKTGRVTEWTFYSGNEQKWCISWKTSEKFNKTILHSYTSEAQRAHLEEELTWTIPLTQRVFAITFSFYTHIWN